MKVKELLNMLKGKEEYEIDIDYVNTISDIEIDDELQTVSIMLDDNNDNFEDDEDFCNFDGDCVDCDEKAFCSSNPDNAWRYSNYEEKDIDDWTVDDHLAAWYDHMMEK